MKTVDSSGEQKLQALLRGARPAPALPPRFEENVWRRLEADGERWVTGEPGWLVALAGWFLKPKLALTLGAVVVLAGLGLGWNSAQLQTKLEAQARYLAAVAPGSLR